MRYTVKQFNAEFPDDDACLEKVFQDRYGDLSCCPHCGVIDSKFYRVKKRKCYACSNCGYQLHPLAGTIFHKSSTSLKDWFYAIYLFLVSKNGVSAKELERHIGVTYKTAHRMAHQIRLLMIDDEEDDPLDGEVEVDETYIGGKHKRKYGMSKKSAVFGMVEREGRVRAKHVKGTGARALLPELTNNIKQGSTVYSDEWRAYSTLSRRGYYHDTVTHSIEEFVRGQVHTNTIEGFWGQLKRSINGTYHHVSAKYLQNYVNEFVFRYNLRNKKDPPVFESLIKNI